VKQLSEDYAIFSIAHILHRDFVLRPTYHHIKISKSVEYLSWKYLHARKVNFPSKSQENIHHNEKSNHCLN